MVRQVRTALVDAFTDEPLSGNAAGVVPDADGLSAAQMQAVARELAVSETAFLLPSGPADRKVRYFTPTQEVELCGHATVAAHAFLREDGAIGAGEHTLETDVGVLDIDVEDGGTVWMTQDDPTVRRIDVEYERLAEALDVPVGSLQDIGADLPLAVASTGLPFLTVPVNFLEHVGNADPDLAAVEALCDEVDATGLYLFTFDALDGDATLHARMFAPGAGVPEDPVTGTASGAAGAYLREVSAFDGELPDEMVFEQGNYLDRPGRVRVRVGESVRVGGDGVVALDGTLSVPADDEDEILEV
jgi:PhzF family phenazine biosynthesis protein